MAASRFLALALTTAVLAGCGTANRNLTAAPRVAVNPVAQAASLLKGDPNHDETHAKLNAIVKSVLTGMYDELLATVDTNKDGIVDRDEYAVGHSNDASWLFQATFDENRDARITRAEYDKAMATGAPVEAYHQFTEKAMSAAIAPYVKEKNFDQPKVRTYLTRDLGLTIDFMGLFALMDKLDLNKDGKVLSGPGEGPAFLLTFARQQMQKALAMKVSPLSE